MINLENDARLRTASSTLLRLAFGFIFLAHGWQKYFQYTIDGATAAFTQMGVPLAGVVAPIAATLEMVGGAALVLGVLTRIFAGLLGLQMLGALVLVHAPAGVFVENGGIELVLALTAGAFALLLLGPGRLSVDALIFRNKRGEKAVATS